MSSRMSYVFIALYLLMPYKNCEAARKYSRSYLARPRDVRWHISGDSLILTWRYSETADPPVGYYVKVQESPWGGGLGPPHFVHVKTPMHHSGLGTVIRGLKPGTRYYIKIIAFSSSRSKSSRAIIVSTSKLEFLEVSNFKASSITDTSAVFTWSHKSANDVHDLSFKIICNGKLTYHENGMKLHESVEFEETYQGSWHQTERHKVTSLVPNTLYTCHVFTVADTQDSKSRSKMIEFKTLPGKPLTPSPPQVVIIDQGKPAAGDPQDKFEVKLFSTSNKYGPISHYVVYAVPVKRDHNAAVSMPYTPIVPNSKLMSKAVSAHLASSVSDKLPFIVGSYETLPEKLVFDGSYESLDFKPDTHYGFVVAAFTQTKDPSVIKFSLSSVSDPPVYIGPDLTKEWIKERKPAAQRFASIVIFTLITFIAVLSFMVFVVVGLAYMKQTQYGPITFDEESDVESHAMRLAKERRRRSRLRLRQSHQNKAYHKLDVDQSGEFQLETRVDQVKKTLQSDEPEQRPGSDLFSVSTPPDSPKSQTHPMSPLVQSKREERYSFSDGTPRASTEKQATPLSSTLTTPQVMNYHNSSVAASINLQDRLAFRQPFQRRKPYVPSKTLVPSHYTATHPPGKKHPVIKPPEAPPFPSAIRLGVKEGYVMPKEGMPKRTLVKVIEEIEQLQKKRGWKQEQEHEGSPIQRISSEPNHEIPHLEGGVMGSSSAYCGEVLSDDDDQYLDAVTCDYHGQRK